jgi:hypothetical protein
LDKIILKISVDGLISRHSWTELEIWKLDPINYPESKN